MRDVNLSALIEEIGEDADLLVRSDAWLEEERKSIGSSLDLLLKELEALNKAKRIKRALQERNMVPVQNLIKDAAGQINDIIIRFMPLPDAINMIRRTHDILDECSRQAQLMSWSADGYDVTTSSKLRPAI